MSKNIKICFAGTMNAMLFDYALYFKDRGYKVCYIVDVPKENTLSRPEAHYDIPYPYPSWIKEIIPIRNIALESFPRLTFGKIISEMNSADVVVANGYAISLLNYIKKDIIKFVNFYGADLDIWCDIRNLEKLSVVSNKFFQNFSFLKSYFVKRKILLNREGVRISDALSYFPKGLNEKGDNLIAEIKSEVEYIRRDKFNMPKHKIEYIENIKKNIKKNKKDTLVLLSPVRFLYRNFSGNNEFENKGNDLIIKGIAKYYKKNTNIEVHFFEKGPDVDNAKKLCKELGIENVVKWHKQLKYDELLRLYALSDICFDQVGDHWIGEIGFISLFMAKPLISNMRKDVFAALWGDTPICDSKTEDDVFNWLQKLSDDSFRERVSKESYNFAIDKLSPNKMYKDFEDIILKEYNDKKINII